MSTQYKTKEKNVPQFKTGIGTVSAPEKRADQIDVKKLRQLLSRQQTVFRAEPYPSAMLRRERLRCLKRALLDHTEALCQALSKDFGHRSRDDTFMGDIMPSLSALKYAMSNLKRWMRPSRRHANLLFQPATAKVIYQPLGVVGIIAPWNYPVFLSLGPLITAIAAGNRAMLKLPELTPHTNRVMTEMLSSCFDDTEVAVVEGEASVGMNFASLPFDHLLFTGSTRVGRHVMRAAAENLTPVTLELGGKSPGVIDHSMPMQQVIKRFIWGKMLNSGQTCVSPDYLLCPEERVEELISATDKLFTGLFPTLANNPDCTAIISDQHFQRLQDWLKEVRQNGTRVEVLGKESEEIAAGQRKMPLTLLIDPPSLTAVMQQEIFGPLLPVVSYRTEQDAIDYINSRPRPLALYLYSHDKQLQRRYETGTHSGGLVFNDSVIHAAQDDLPFGGIGSSGMGQYHGKEGFLTMSKAKPVLCRGRLFPGSLLFPPYNRFLHRLVYRLFLR